MPENMSISVNGQSQVPPGFRFHPTEEELLQYYLRKKVSYEQIDLDVIRDVDLNKLEPWDIQERCKIGSTPQNDWYFFSHKDKKYPTGTRTNRATAVGFWKATGRDKVIYSNSKRIGMRKTLVFYKGRAPHGQKSDWIMHEYRLDDNIITMGGHDHTNNVCEAGGSEGSQEEGWVVCRIFKKKNHHKTLDSPMIMNSPNNINFETMRAQLPTSSSDEGTLEQILHYMGRSSCKKEGMSSNPAFLMPIDTGTRHHDRFMKLPSLDSPDSMSRQQALQVQMFPGHHDDASNIANSGYQPDTSARPISDWAALDRLVASQLNGQSTEPPSKQQLLLAACFSDHSAMALCSPTYHHDPQQQALRSSFSVNNRALLMNSNTHQDDNGEFDLWSFARATADPQSQMSNTPPV